MVQTNRRGAWLKPLLIDDYEIPMVSPEKGFKVLVTILTLTRHTSTEFQARMSAAWGKFHQMWPLLGKRDADVSKRLRLFDMSVSQTALWCNESWLLTLKEKTRQASVVGHFAHARCMDPPVQADTGTKQYYNRSAVVNIVLYVLRQVFIAPPRGKRNCKKTRRLGQNPLTPLARASYKLVASSNRSASVILLIPAGSGCSSWTVGAASCSGIAVSLNETLFVAMYYLKVQGTCLPNFEI